MVKEKETTLFELSDYNFYSKSDVKENLFSTEMKQSVDKVIVKGKTYGPGKLEIAIRNLDATALGNINKLVAQTQNGNSLEKQKAYIAMLPEIPRLLNQGAELEVSAMNLTVPEGKIEGYALISLPKGAVGNIFDLALKLHGKAQLKMPMPVVKQILMERNYSSKYS